MESTPQCTFAVNDCVNNSWDEIPIHTPQSSWIDLPYIMFGSPKLKLKDGGLIYFEINPKFKNQLISLSQKYQFINHELKKDIFNRTRYIKFQKWTQKNKSKF